MYGSAPGTLLTPVTIPYLSLCFIHTLSLSETVSALQFPVCRLFPSQLWVPHVQASCRLSTLTSVSRILSDRHSVVQPCLTLAVLLTTAHQAPLPVGFSRQECWTVLPISFSRGSSRSGDQTHIPCVSCISRWIPYHEHHLGSPRQSINNC